MTSSHDPSFTARFSNAVTVSTRAVWHLSENSHALWNRKHSYVLLKRVTLLRLERNVLPNGSSNKSSCFKAQIGYLLSRQYPHQDCSAGLQDCWNCCISIMIISSLRQMNGGTMASRADSPPAQISSTQIPCSVHESLNNLGMVGPLIDVGDLFSNSIEASN